MRHLLIGAAAVALLAHAGLAQTEQFVGGQAAQVATLQLRSEAVVYGPDATLKQVCRWGDAEAQAFMPVADLVIVHLSEKSACDLTVADVKKTLTGAGFSLAAVNFAGPTRCAVRRSDAPPLADSQIEKPAEVASKTSDVETGSTTLRQLLTDDLAARINLKPDALQLDFDPADEKLLTLAAPLFTFGVEPRHASSLGRVSWTVTVRTAAGETSKSTVAATARAWQDQLALARPLANQQIIGADDLTPRRQLVDRLDPPAATADQVVGQQASRALPPGSVLTPRDVEPVRLSAPGQLIGVTLSEGGVRVKTVAKALDAGYLGQSVRVRNEATRAIYSVTLTGPQTAVIGPEGTP